MISNLKEITIVICVLICCSSTEFLTHNHAARYTQIIPSQVIADRHANRVKRQGGGGVIPFRPLFVYRQQQREQQERIKEIETRKKLREEQLLQYQRYQQYQESIKSPQPSLSQYYQQYQESIKSHQPSLSQYYQHANYDAYPSYQSYSAKPYSEYQTYYNNYPYYTYETGQPTIFYDSDSYYSQYFN